MIEVKNISENAIPLQINGSMKMLPPKGKLTLNKTTPQIENLKKPFRGKKALLSVNKI